MNFKALYSPYRRIRQWLKVDLKLARKGLILVFVPMSFVLIIMFYLVALLNEAESDVWRQSESKMIIATANALSRSFPQAAPSEISEKIETLKELSMDNPTQLINVANLEQVINRGLDLREQADRAKNKEKIEEQIDHLERDLNIQVKNIENEEQEELNKGLLKSSATRAIVRNGLYAAVILNIVLALLMAIYFSKGITQRLALVFENSKRLAKGLPLLPTQEGHDEIARVDLVFHKMAETLEEMTRKQKAIMDNTIDVIFTIDDNRCFSMINNACRQSWGYEPNELIGQPITKVLHKADHSLTMVLINKLMRGSLSRTFETRLVRKDGRIIDLLWSATWSKMEESLFCVAHDITQRKEIERLKRDFFAMISHDLRTPLNSILFSLSIAAKRIENLAGQLAGRQAAETASELTEELKASERNCAHLLKMIDSILIIEKMESGQIELVQSMFKLSALITRAEDAVNAYAKQHQVKLVRNLEEAIIAADEDRLLQVLINLLGNAIKFSPPKSEVKLTAHMFDGHLICEVKDQGPGISEEFQQTIFDRYKQVKGSGNAAETGTGLGLTICRAIVKAHGGDIGVTSSPGQGSTFWFKIPVISVNQSLEDKKI